MVMGGVSGSMADGICIAVDVGFVGSSSRVRSPLRFSGSGGGFDAISGEGRRSLLLLLVFFYEDVDDGVFLGEQD